MCRDDTAADVVLVDTCVAVVAVVVAVVLDAYVDGVPCSPSCLHENYGMRVAT